MVKNNVKNGHCPYWPISDLFFGYGVKSLLTGLDQSSDENDYFFINLNRHTLKFFLQDFAEFRSKKIIIISSPRLMPLATFWLTESNKVCALFGSCTPVEEIVRVLNIMPPETKTSLPALRAKETMSLREVFFLKNYLEKGKLARFPLLPSMGSSTLKNRKISVARKLGVRKLEQILLLK